MEIHAITLRKAMVMLATAGCAFAIKDAQGNVHGSLKLAEPEPEKPPKKRKHAGVTEYIASQLITLMPGQSTMVIPSEQFPMDAISTTTASTCIRLWGKDTYATHKTAEYVEVSRFA